MVRERNNCKRNYCSPYGSIATRTMRHTLPYIGEWMQARGKRRMRRNKAINKSSRTACSVMSGNRKPPDGYPISVEQ